MPATTAVQDDRLTIISISALACILQDILHEGLGHGVVAWLSGAHTVILSTVAMQSDIDTRWIAAAGTVVNLIFGALLWALLLRAKGFSPAMRYFLVLAMAGNLFTATGYFMFSGVMNFGDWAVVIQGLQPAWVWRLGLILLGAASYYASMMLVAEALRPFQRDNKSRMRHLCWTPYVTDGVLATVAGVLNPAGLFYVIASAIPATLGANSGMLSLPSMLRNKRPQPDDQAEIIARSPLWITLGAIASLLFIVVLGRGITFSR